MDEIQIEGDGDYTVVFFDKDEDLVEPVVKCFTFDDAKKYGREVIGAGLRPKSFIVETTVYDSSRRMV